MNRFDKIARDLTAGLFKKVVKTRNIKVEVVDYTDDKDEPAYDVEVFIDGVILTGGKVFSTGLGTDRAFRQAEAFADGLVRKLVRETGGTLRN